MSRRYRSPGRVLNLPAPDKLDAGQPVAIGQFFGIAETAAAGPGESVEVLVEGIIALPRVNTETWKAGDLVYWDDTLQLVTAVADTRLLVGAAAEPAEVGQDTAEVRLNGIARANETLPLLITVADDAELAALLPSLEPRDDGRLIMVTSRSSQGPQLLRAGVGASGTFVPQSATVTIKAEPVPPQAVNVAAGADINLAAILDARLTSEFPADAWDWQNYEFVSPYPGTIDLYCMARFDVNAPCVMELMIQAYQPPSGPWQDVGAIVSQEVAPLTFPSQVTGIDQYGATPGLKTRLIIRHDAPGVRTFTISKAFLKIAYTFAI